PPPAGRAPATAQAASRDTIRRPIGPSLRSLARAMVAHLPPTCRAHTAEGYSGLVQRRMPAVLRRRGVVIGLQIVFIVAFTAILGWVLGDTWGVGLPHFGHAVRGAA